MLASHKKDLYFPVATKAEEHHCTELAGNYQDKTLLLKD